MLYFDKIKVQRDIRSAWPDWAIFKVLGDKLSYKSSPKVWWLLGYFEKHHFKVKTAVACFGAIYGKVLGTSYFNIWSHWIRCTIGATINIWKTFKFQIYSPFLAEEQDSWKIWQFWFWFCHPRTRSCGSGDLQIRRRMSRGSRLTARSPSWTSWADSRGSRVKTLRWNFAAAVKCRSWARILNPLKIN